MTGSTRRKRSVVSTPYLNSRDTHKTVVLNESESDARADFDIDSLLSSSEKMDQVCTLLRHLVMLTAAEDQLLKSPQRRGGR